MPPETGTALLILVAFILPGFVALLVSERTHTVRGQDTAFERLLQALYYSALTYAVVIGAAAIWGCKRSDVESLVRTETSLRRLGVLGFLIVFVIPVGISQMGRLWRKSQRARPIFLNLVGVDVAHTTPAGWDHFFQGGAVALVRVTLDDGRVVGGFFGGDSFAGYSEQAQDLFLEERWEMDDDAWFLRPAPASSGVWVSRRAIKSIEFYEPPRRRQVTPV